MASDGNAVIHRGVALMVCDNEAILEETLKSIDISDMNIQRLGNRAIAAPAYQLEQIQEILQNSGTYPKVICDIVPPSRLEESEEDEEESSEETEQEETD